jgi:hypothetical protein
MDAGLFAAIKTKSPVVKTWIICPTAGKTSFFRSFRPFFWRRN